MISHWNKGREKLLRDHIGTLNVVDAHTHLQGFFESCPLKESVGFLLDNYLCYFLEHATLSREENCAGQTDFSRFSYLCQLWPRLRFTGLGKTVRYTLQAMGLNGELTPETYPLLLEKLQQRNAAQMKREYCKAGITASLTNTVGHPNWGGLQSILEYRMGKFQLSENFYPVISVDPFTHIAMPDAFAKWQKSGAEGNQSLAAYVSWFSQIITDCKYRGAKGLKNTDAYNRGLLYPEVENTTAEKIFSTLMRGQEISREETDALASYLFRQIADLAGTLDLPIAVHTGFLLWHTEEKANAAHLAQLLADFPATRFDLLHLNYPYLEDFFALVSSFPNTVANCCWATLLNPDYTEAFLHRALHALPANRVIVFGSDDGHYPEYAIGHLELVRDIISRTLVEEMDKGVLSEKEAVQMAKLWLSDNATEMYHLPRSSG